LFFSVRLEQNTVFVFNPEIAGGKGFSGVDGIANPPNGDIPRVASATPKPYVARLFIQNDFGFDWKLSDVPTLRVNERIGFYAPARPCLST
jgi:hypothetical protein